MGPVFRLPRLVDDSEKAAEQPLPTVFVWIE